MRDNKESEKGKGKVDLFDLDFIQLNDDVA